MKTLISLEDWASQASAMARLPDFSGEESMIWPNSLAPLPERLSSKHLCMSASRHTYAPAYEVDLIVFGAPKGTYRALGLLIIASIFEDRDVIIELNQNIDSLLITSQALNNHVIPNARLRLEGFEYFPQKVTQVPWERASFLDPYTLPWFCIASAADLELEISSDAKVASGFGSMAGSLRLAQLFLDLSQPTNDCVEVCLEVEGGNRGVAPLSCEARFWLPGSIGYDVLSV